MVCENVLSQFTMAKTHKNMEKYLQRVYGLDSVLVSHSFISLKLLLNLYYSWSNQLTDVLVTPLEKDPTGCCIQAIFRMNAPTPSPHQLSSILCVY